MKIVKVKSSQGCLGKNTGCEKAPDLVSKKGEDVWIVESNIDETNKNINKTRIELKEEIAKNTSRIDEINKRIDRLYEVIVKKEEHIDLVVRVTKLEEKLKEIEVRVTP